MERKEGDLIFDLGYGNFYDKLAMEAQLMAQEFRDRELTKKSTELAQLVEKYPYNNDKFYLVITKAQELMSAMEKATRKHQVFKDRVKQYKKEKNAEKPLSDEIVFHEPGDISDWHFIVREVDRDDPLIGEACYKGAEKDKTIHEIVIENWRLKKQQRPRFSRLNKKTSAKAKNFMDNAIGLRFFEMSEEKIDYVDHYQIKTEFKNEKTGRLVAVFYHHFHHNADEEGYVFHYFFQDKAWAKRFWERIKKMQEDLIKKAA